MIKSFQLCAGIAAAVLLSSAAANAGGMMTGKNGMTLYTYDKDMGGKSACDAMCATMWPPYMAKAHSKTMKNWSMIKRNNGMMQWAYDGKPVYFYAGDKKMGDVMGDGSGGKWHAVAK